MQTPSTEDRKDRSAKLCMAYQVSIVKVDCNEKQPKNVSFEGEEAWIEEQPRGEGNGETLPVS